MLPRSCTPPPPPPPPASLNSSALTLCSVTRAMSAAAAFAPRLALGSTEDPKLPQMRLNRFRALMQTLHLLLSIPSVCHPISPSLLPSPPHSYPVMLLHHPPPQPSPPLPPPSLPPSALAASHLPSPSFRTTCSLLAAGA
jgi:hypothetical protein